MIESDHSLRQNVLLENCKSHADHGYLGEPLLEVTLLGLGSCRHGCSDNS
jgi:hypothetical protein